MVQNPKLKKTRKIIINEGMDYTPNTVLDKFPRYFSYTMIYYIVYF